jgi:hypothetical protein
MPPDVLHELRDRLAALERRLDALEASAASTCRRLRPTDRDRLARLLPAIIGALGSQPFAVRELQGPAVALAAAGLSPRSIGRLFLRADGLPVAGFVVLRVGDEGGCALWSVRQVVSEGFLPVETTAVPSITRRSIAS